MTNLYKWIKDIAFFMILMTIALNIVPNSSYRKYVKLFASMIMVIISISPLMGFLNLEGSMDQYFRSFSFTEEVNQLKPMLEGSDDKRITAVIKEYKNTILREMESSANVLGLTIKSADIVLYEDMEDENFGKISTVALTVGLELAQSTVHIEPVKIQGTKEEETPSTGILTVEAIKLKEQLQKDYKLKEDQLSIYMTEP